MSRPTRGNKEQYPWLHVLLALALSLAFLSTPAPLAWCSDHDLEKEEQTTESIDPFEDFNRAVFDFNEALDAVIFLPLAQIYRAIFPKPIRDTFRNFMRNLNAPFILANDILQGEGERAGMTLSRFFINTTLGVVGLFDVATNLGVPYHEEDFGQTLGVWDVAEGVYLVLPIIGPSTVRDALGKVGDAFINPLNYAGAAGDDVEKIFFGHRYDLADILFGIRLLEGIDARERLIEPLELLKKDPLALDHYTLIRSVYLQRRKKEILNK
ncbi:MAG: VacJ family lipoprotein [Nitrospinae bacterium]|nr:VacJ family lipoprotein [Nitrospinota bacterium]